LAYVLEPAVDHVQRRWRSVSRAGAVAVVYILGAALVCGVGYALAPAITGQLKPLQATAPDVLARFSDRQFLSQHGSQITGIVERTAGGLAGSLENVGWLLMVPIAAAFVLIDRARLFDGTIDLLARGRDREGTRRTVEQIDATLAQYARAQLTVAGLSAAF